MCHVWIDRASMEFSPAGRAGLEDEARNRTATVQTARFCFVLNNPLFGHSLMLRFRFFLRRRLVQILGTVQAIQEQHSIQVINLML